MSSPTVTVRMATTADSPRLQSFYSNLNYPGTITSSAVVLIAEENGLMVGIVRLEPEHGEIVLRGMRVAGPEQRRGIGTVMLRAVEKYLDHTRCYCIAFAYLRDFYGRVGFKEVDDAAAPSFLQERIAQYRTQGGEFVIMKRGR